MASKARAFYRFELLALTGSLLLLLLAGLMTFFSHSAANGVGVLAVLISVLARALSLLGRGIRYEPKLRLLLFFLILLGLVFMFMGTTKLFMLMLLIGLDMILLYNHYRKTK